MIGILLIFIYLSNFISGEAISSQITCYHCNSLETSTCMSVGSNTGTCHSSLSTKGTSLQLGCSKVAFTLRQNSQIYRNCEFTNNCSSIMQTIKRTYPEAIFNYCNICQTDKCNTGHEVKSTLLLVGAATLFYFVRF